MRRLVWSIARIMRLCAVGLAAMLAIPQIVHAATCDDLLPTVVSTRTSRQLEARDLVRLRDIGFPASDLYAYDDALSVSPTGDRLAFVLRRADPDRNAYCSGLVMLELASGHLTLLDSSPELVLARPVAIRGLLTPQGLPAPNPPQWSPDGNQLSWLKRVGGVTQAWTVDVNEGSARPAAILPGDVDSTSWARDGKSLFVAFSQIVTPGAGERLAGQRGHLYDDRYVPAQGSDPQFIAPAARSFVQVSPATNTVEPVSLQDAAPHFKKAGDFEGDESATSPKSKARAWIASARPGSLFSPQRLWLAIPGRPDAPCHHAACLGKIYNLLWSYDGRFLLFLRREGANGETTALYRWEALSSIPPRRLLSTPDVLASCRTTGPNLTCLRDSSSSPRRIVRISTHSGESALVFDPNPEFRSLTLGKVERLRWTNRFGLETWGDLVLPPDLETGRKLPLIVVQYHSDGFLRGGTGDEYPIHLFASRGIAVLSVERVATYASTLPDVPDYKEANRVNGVGWRERQSLLSSIEAGVRKAIDRGVVDPSRIGLTGLSDGATTTQFALINSTTFAAAVMSSCCIDANTVMIYGGPRWAEELQRRGYPPLTKPDPGFWTSMSLAANAAKIHAPILLQLPSEEYLLALETFTALRELNKPVEMYVFPDEHHVKIQPAHRLAIYERNLAWFEFWFLNRKPLGTLGQEEYSRWAALKAAQSLSSELRN